MHHNQPSKLNYFEPIATYIASNIVGSLSSAGHDTYKDGYVHNVASRNDEIIEIWTYQSYDPVYST